MCACVSVCVHVCVCVCVCMYMCVCVGRVCVCVCGGGECMHMCVVVMCKESILYIYKNDLVMKVCGLFTFVGEVRTTLLKLPLLSLLLCVECTSP